MPPKNRKKSDPVTAAQPDVWPGPAHEVGIDNLFNLRLRQFNLKLVPLKGDKPAEIYKFVAMSFDDVYQHIRRTMPGFEVIQSADMGYVNVLLPAEDVL